MVHVLTSLWKENMYLASAWIISCSDVAKCINTIETTSTKILWSTD